MEKFQEVLFWIVVIIVVLVVTGLILSAVQSPEPCADAYEVGCTQP